MRLAIPAVMLAAVALAGGAPPGADGAGASADQPPDLEALLEQARRVQEVDLAAWSGYRFRRLETRQKLDDAGQPIYGRRTEALVSPVRDGFDEKLLTIDGRPATDAEVAEHRGDGRFARRYSLMMRGEGDPDKGGYSLGFLLRMASYRHAGIEKIEGVACHRLDFSPGDSVRDSVVGRFAAAMAGSIWITEEGLHVARASARSVSPISLAFIVLRLEDLQIHLESGPVGDGRWMPRRIEVRTRARILGFPTRKRSLLEYLDFVPVPPEPVPTASSP